MMIKFPLGAQLPIKRIGAVSNAETVPAQQQERVPRLAGYSVQFNPFNNQRLVIGCNFNYGIIGNGSLLVLEYGDLNRADIKVISQFHTKDSVGECCWSEQNPNLLLAGCGDGSLVIFDCSLSRSLSQDSNKTRQPILWRGMSLPQSQFRNTPSFNSNNPQRRDILGVSWNQVSRDNFLSCSCDGSVQLWSTVSTAPLASFSCESACVYGVSWNPRSPFNFSTVSGDGVLRCFDTRTPLKSQVELLATHGELLSLDYNKYHDFIIYTGGVDGNVNCWDLRNAPRHASRAHPSNPLRSVMMGHQLGVRRIRAHPFDSRLLATSGYDCSVRLWDSFASSSADLTTPTFSPTVGECLINDTNRHSEFVFGLDFSLDSRTPNLLASCSWDGTVTLSQLPAMPSVQ